MSNVFTTAAKPTLGKILAVVLLYLALWYFHIACQPYAYTGGAILPDGSVGGGLITKCPLLSEAIWNNPSLYNFYAHLNGWWLLIISVAIVYLFLLAAARKKVIANKAL